MPLELTFKLSDFMRMKDIYRLQRGIKAVDSHLFQCVSDIATFLENSDQNHIPASGLIEVVIPCISESFFTLKKNYTVVKEVPYAAGKWSESLGNSFFMDSQYMIPDFIDMAKQRLEETLLDHRFDPTSAIEIYEELTELLVKKFDKVNQNDYALIVLGKMASREEMYLYGVSDVLI